MSSSSSAPFAGDAGATTSPARLRAGDESPRERAVSAFADLNRTIHAAGLMRRRYGVYWTRFGVLVVLLAGVFVALVVIGPSWWQLLVAAALAVVLGQVMFLGHDAAHRQVFRSGRWNDWASLVIGNLIAGVSYGWWQHKHTRHHAKPNQVGADPDVVNGTLVFHLEDGPVRRTGLRRWFTEHQGWLFFPLLLLEGLNLHVSGVKTIFGRGPVKRRPVEIAFITVRLGGYLGVVFWLLPPLMALAFLAVQLGVFGVYMGAVFAPNHKGMPILPRDAHPDFLRRQVLTSRNIRGGWWMSAFMGGLNYQVEHHLFPSMPSANLRRARPVVRDFCAQRDVPYTETNLLRSYGIVVRHLNQVGLAARDPFDCPVVAQFRVTR